MKSIFLVVVLSTTPVLGEMPLASSDSNRHYLLTELNRPTVKEVIETVGETVKRKPVRTFLSKKIRNLKWHPVTNTVRKLKDRG